MRPVHSRRQHVALGDTDAAQVIYFAAVFRWHEQSFSEWLAGEYMPLSRILASGPWAAGGELLGQLCRVHPAG